MNNKPNSGLVPLANVIAMDHHRRGLPPLTVPRPGPSPAARCSSAAPLTDPNRLCSRCGQVVGTRYAYAWLDGTRYRCACIEEQVRQETSIYEATLQTVAAHESAQALSESGMVSYQYMTLQTFDPGRLRSATPDAHPYCIAIQWLNAILAAGDQAAYHDPDSPPAALYFYYSGKGRGKTHLAAAIAWEAWRAGKRTAILEETSYLRHRWGCSFEAMDALVALPAERAWLTVIDDLGRRPPGRDRAGQPTDSIATAWFDVIGPRWLRRGWTIVTSNYTPEELWERGTIEDATYSRLMQMIGKRLICFDGEDARLGTKQ